MNIKDTSDECTRGSKKFGIRDRSKGDPLYSCKNLGQLCSIIMWQEKF